MHILHLLIKLLTHFVVVNVIFQQCFSKIEATTLDHPNNRNLNSYSIDNQQPNLPISFLDGTVIMSNKNTPNLTAITWAHAVNSQQELHDALNSDINMIEADIVVGKLNNTGADLPVMAHPPANSSDISLLEFLERIMVFNNENVHRTKGVKLDFKSIEVFESSLPILDEKVSQMTYPLWLNADIISGPVNQNNTIPVDPKRFFAGAARYPKAVLSIGWTTRWSSSYMEGEYTYEQIENMLSAIRQNNVTATRQPITFPVRAGIAANSLQQLEYLVKSVNDTNESTLTIWSSQNDYVNVEKLRELIFRFGFHRVYLDVPEHLENQLHLDRNAGYKNVNSLFCLIVSAMLALFLARIM